MKNNTTNPVSGKDFMFRDYEKKFCISSLKEGNSLLILGIRRTGKSSLMKEVARIMNEDGYQIIEVDCQDSQKPSELFMEILKKLPKNTFDKLTTHLKSLKSIPGNIIETLNIDSIKGFGVDLAFDKQIRDFWMPISKSIEKVLLSSDEKIILFLDELPFFFENLLDENNNGKYTDLEVKQILTTLRGWRNEGIQMVLCGSLNISNFLESRFISQKILSGLVPVDIKLFTDDEAIKLLEELAKSKDIEWIKGDVSKKVIELVQDNVPFFIQRFFSYLAIENECSIEKLQEIYDLHVYPSLIKSFLYQFEERLSNYSQEEQEHATEILDYFAKNGTASFDEIRKKNKKIELKLFLKLISDEFFKPEKNNNHSFVLNCVKNWWMEKRGIKNN